MTTTAKSKFQSVDVALAARKKADAEFLKLAPFYTKNGLTLERITSKEILDGMIMSLYDSSKTRWGNTTLQYLQLLMKDHPYDLDSSGGNDNRLPIYYAYNNDAPIHIKYYIANQMCKQYNYVNKAHAEEQTMIKNMHDHIGWKSTSKEYVKKMIKENYSVDNNNILLKNGGIHNCLPIKYAVEYNANQKVVNFLVEEMIRRHRELKTNDIVLEQSIMIENLWESKYKNGWPHTTVQYVKKLIKKDPNALLKVGGKANRLPIYYAVRNKCKTNVKDFILTEMVMSNKYKTKYIALKTTMIKDLWDSIGWRETTIDVVKELVMVNRLALFQDRNGNEVKNRNGMIPLHFAIAGGARLDVVEWICEQMGFDKIKTIKDTYRLGTLLHCVVRCKHHHLIPYLLFTNPKAADIRDLYGFTPIDYAKENNDKKSIDFLSDSKKTIKGYEKYSVVRVGYSPVVQKRSDGKFYPSPTSDDL